MLSMPQPPARACLRPRSSESQTHTASARLLPGDLNDSAAPMNSPGATGAWSYSVSSCWLKSACILADLGSNFADELRGRRRIPGRFKHSSGATSPPPNGVPSRQVRLKSGRSPVRSRPWRPDLRGRGRATAVQAMTRQSPTVSVSYLVHSSARQFANVFDSTARGPSLP
jgi:hypothetical protein